MNCHLRCMSDRRQVNIVDVIAVCCFNWVFLVFDFTQVNHGKLVFPQCIIIGLQHI